MTKVCIIGSGISGLVSLKWCLEVGLQPQCYETCYNIGGLWNYDESKLRKNGPRLYSSLICNLSKEMMAFSDFPMPKDYPPYLDWKRFLDYLETFAEKFDLKKHIKFQHKVLNTEEIEIDGVYKWRVTIKSKETNLEFTQEFDKLIICVGNARNYLPTFKGQDSFKGKILHSADYASEENFNGQKVIVVGSANSGCDLAVGIGQTATNTYLSSRRGAFIVNRLKQGYPMDLMNFSRFKTIARNMLPEPLINMIINKIINAGFDHKVYGLDSGVKSTSPLSNFVVNDGLPLSIARGKVTVVPEIEKIVGSNVHLVNGRVLEDIDVIYCATGYKPNFPFISDTIMQDDPSDFKMHRFIFPLAASDPTSIAVVGNFPAAGESRTLIAEMQARYAAYVFCGHTKLPPMRKMLEDHNKMYKYFSQDGSFGYQLRPQIFGASLATELGVYPSFFRVLFTDPRLAMATFFGPTVPYIYRVVGRDSCPNEVRDAILNVWKNTFAGLNHY